MGRIFAKWAIIILEQVFQIKSRAQIVWLLFQLKKVCINFGKLTDWATLWAIFS
jgi:hypothetical protein